jgi:hypothetical protein
MTKLFLKRNPCPFLTRIEFNYITLRNKWMYQKSRNYLIYYNQLSDLSLLQLYPVTEVYTMQCIHSWINSCQSVVACSWNYTHDIYFWHNSICFLQEWSEFFLLLIITYFAYFCNGEDRLVKFHLTADRTILCAEQHTTVWSSCHCVIMGRKNSSGYNWMCELWTCAAE